MKYKYIILFGLLCVLFYLAFKRLDIYLNVEIDKELRKGISIKARLPLNRKLWDDKETAFKDIYIPQFNKAGSLTAYIIANSATMQGGSKYIKFKDFTVIEFSKILENGKEFFVVVILSGKEGVYNSATGSVDIPSKFNVRRYVCRTKRMLSWRKRLLMRTSKGLTK